MNKLIIVCGLGGSGKTTLAEELSKKTGIVCFHKDSLKENLYELFDGDSLESSVIIGKKSIKLLFAVVEEQLSRGVDVIIEAPFNFPEDYDIFKGWQEKYGLDVYSVICSIDNETRKSRFHTRERHLSHHDQDRKVSFNDEYDYRDIPGKQIRVATDRSVDEIVDDIILELKENKS